MEEKKSFKTTLNLPKTEFSIRANAQQKERELLERWNNEQLYQKASAKNAKTKKTFTLHDGPPFANGHMHMGHALNRTLKDIVCKAKRMSGYNIISFPGWDCHGLPIELKVAKELGENRDPDAAARVAFKKKCREYAQKWVDIQREEIKRLGVVADWDHPYITMSPQYEAAIIKSFAEFVEKGYIERKGKTVPWCGSCQTVLATAEIEYQDKKDPSCYILFPFESAVTQKVFPELAGKKTSLLVWTTTPWTIPLNRAVVLHPKAPYVVLQGKTDDQAFIVGEKLAETVCKQVGIEKKVLATFTTDKLVGALVNHPYIENLQVPVILDDMVLLEDGTACVHSAPGCGPDDYVLGVKNGLEIFSPLSADGTYTEGIEPKELEGMAVTDGQIWSIKKMAETGTLFHKASLKHSYPHCWRCHKPLMFRATDQWFCDLNKDNLVGRALEIVEGVGFVPDWGKTRLSSTIGSRTEWCLSRQRQWGVPIISLLCSECDHAYLDPTFIKDVARHVETEGVEFWDRVTLAELVKLGCLPEGFACPKCNASLDKLKKEMDIVDVWFESGVSHTAVKSEYPALTIPADLYLEGSDQHRGWFQSSLLSSVIMYDKPCTKSFVTHAFVLDAKAQKMSKSKGNVISPQDVIEKTSADILRLWVASSDFEDDILFSYDMLKSVSEMYRKIRNTCRFMISNLYDFDHGKDAVKFEGMLPLDQYALARLQEVIGKVRDGYDQYWFTSVVQTINRYCTNDLSSFYLDICKDRLYTEASDGLMRRSAQTAMHQILDTLTRLMAPVLSFLAEEVSDVYQKDKTESIHLQSLPESYDIWEIVSQKISTSHLAPVHRPPSLQKATFGVRMTGWWQLLGSIRPELLKAIEGLREQGLVKHSLEAKMTIYVDEAHEDAQVLQAFVAYVRDLGDTQGVTRFFKDFMIVSQFEFAQSPEGLSQASIPWLYVRVDHADGTKCPRCWQWDTTDHPDGLCARCVAVLNA